MIRPFMSKLTRSEIHAVCTGGFATIAGSVMAAYILYGVIIYNTNFNEIDLYILFYIQTMHFYLYRKSVYQINSNLHSHLYFYGLESGPVTTNLTTTVVHS